MSLNFWFPFDKFDNPYFGVIDKRTVDESQLVYVGKIFQT